jgi:hypothetical protein
VNLVEHSSRKTVRDPQPLHVTGPENRGVTFWPSASSSVTKGTFNVVKFFPLGGPNGGEFCDAFGPYEPTYGSLQGGPEALLW